MEVGGLEVALGRIDEVGVDGEAVEVPRAIRELLDTGELAPGEAGVLGGRRVVEVVVGRREVFPERTLRGLELVGGEEALEQREALVADLVERGVGDTHLLRTLGQRAWLRPCGPRLARCSVSVALRLRLVECMVTDPVTPPDLIFGIDNSRVW